MSQDFFIVNRDCQQYINPYRFPAHHRCPSIIAGKFMQAAITFLTTRSTNPKWVSVRESSSLTTKALLGTWVTGAEIIGSYADESAWGYARESFEDISLKCIVMLIDMRHPESREGILNVAEDSDWFRIAERVLEYDKDFITPFLKQQFGEKWEQGFYQAMGDHWTARTGRKMR